MRTRRIATQGLPGNSLEIAIQGLLDRVAALEEHHSYSTELPRRKSQRRSVAFTVQGTSMSASAGTPTIRTGLSLDAYRRMAIMAIELLDAHEEFMREQEAYELMDEQEEDPVAMLEIEIATLRHRLATLKRRHA